MPLPTPNKGENKENFLKRCTANSTVNNDFGDTDQRMLYVIHNEVKKKSLRRTRLWV